LSAIGPSDHDEFCQRDEWQDVGGTRHDKWEKRLADGRLLRTTVQRHKSDYGPKLKSMVLAQLEVDETTFWQVIETGTPAHRPAPSAEVVPEPLADWIVHALQQGRLNVSEIASLTAEEAEHLAVTYFSMPRDLPGEEIRQRLITELGKYRDGVGT
jgi:hypothetical protein